MTGSGCLFYYNLCLIKMFHTSSLLAVAYCGTHSSHFVSNLQNCGESQFPFPKSWCHFHVIYAYVFTNCGSKTLKQQGVLESMCECMLSNIIQQTEHSVSKYETLQTAVNGIKDTVIPVPMVQRNSILSLFIAVKLRT